MEIGTEADYWKDYREWAARARTERELEEKLTKLEKRVEYLEGAIARLQIDRG